MEGIIRMKERYEDMTCDIVMLEGADIIVTSVGTYDDNLPDRPDRLQG